MVLSQYEAEASKEAVRVAAEAGFSVEKADVELEKIRSRSNLPRCGV